MVYVVVEHVYDRKKAKHVLGGQAYLVWRNRMYVVYYTVCTRYRVIFRVFPPFIEIKWSIYSGLPTETTRKEESLLSLFPVT